MPETTSSRERSFARGEALIIWVLWLTYGSFYFCRTNISAAVPGMESDLGLTKKQIGLILGSLKLTYAIGQLLNGQLAERFSARRLLAAGMLCSAALNVLFGLSAGFYFLLFVWAVNGYFQALGWTPSMRVAASWFPVAHRGRAIGIIGTGYQATGALTYVVSGLAAHWFGWQFAFYIPALLLTASSVHMLFLLEDAPPPSWESEPLAAGGGGDGPSSLERSSFLHNVTITVTNPALWLLAISLLLLDACRYGFLDWGIPHLKEVQATGVGTAAVKYAILPLGGIAGAYAAGWASDRFFAGCRAPVIAILLVLLGLLTLTYSNIEHAGTGRTLVTLALVGFAIYGPQVLLVGTAPVDLGRAAPAAAAGFVNFMGYMGASAGDLITGKLVGDFSWKVAVYFWAGCAFLAAISASALWNVRGSREKDAA